MKKIGLVAAMAKELNVFLQNIGKETAKYTHKSFTVYLYQVNGKSLYVTDSGVGEVSSAIATQMLIDLYGVEGVINFGVCGSLDSSISVADIVFGESVYHFDRDTQMLDNCPIGYYTEYETKYIPCRGELLDLATSLFPDVKKVIVASSEKFVANTELKNALKKENASICEMEALGVGLTALKNDIPCLLVKAISDNADEKACMSFNEMLTIAMEKCSKVVQSLIQNI